ncbi:hypothetical protein DMUE_4969 [Dictyocoela muelleri]|nr:hypothetical protein DMUE_4969 [Dictyocoela muelleri]
MNIEYQGTKHSNYFYIFKNGIIGLILGNSIINSFVNIENNDMNNNKGFPVTCKIEAKPVEIVGWYRNIRNIKEKKEFQILVEKLESEGKIEKSSSSWLNPLF